NNQNQTDEEDLMPYDVLKQIELEAILNGKSPRQVYDLLKDLYDESEAKGWVKKFFQLWTRNQWKRERYAPSFHFDDFNIDPRSWYRFPILSGGYKEELENL
ncbi:MAG: NAD+ synthetase, partial [Cyclobacteriaceae bacterium]